MHRVASRQRQQQEQKQQLRAEWPSNAEHLDALDRELALISCTKIWVDGATAGVTPRTAMRSNSRLMERRKLLKNQKVAASSRPSSPNSTTSGASIFVYTTSQMKKLKVVDKRRHAFVQQSCRNFALAVCGLKKGLKKDLEALTQSVIEERPCPMPEIPDSFIMSNGYDVEGDEEAVELPEGWMNIDLTLPSPREDAFGKSRHARSMLLLPPLENLNTLDMHDSQDIQDIQNTQDMQSCMQDNSERQQQRQRQRQQQHDDMVTISKHGPFGGRASGKLLRPSIISMDPSRRLEHVRRVLPGIVQSISDEIVHGAIRECKYAERLRPIPKISSRAAKIFSKSFDAVVTKQREAINTLASTQIRDIVQKLRKELNTVKAVQSSLGATWMMLVAFVNRHQMLGRAVILARAKGKLNRAASKIQAAIRASKTREMEKKIDHVRPILTRNVWWFVLKMKTKMRRRQSKLLRKFVNDYVGGVGVQQIIYKFRWKVIRTQQTVRSFLVCKKARMLALQLYWDKEEKLPRSQKELSALKREATATPGTMGGGNDKNGKKEEEKETYELSVVPRETFQALASSFHSRYLKTNSVLLHASMARLGNSEELAQIEALGKWSKWRGGFARVCSKDVMRDCLEPFLLTKRRLYIEKKNAQADKVNGGVQANDMMAFMQGESWEELAERIKPPPVPWLLFTELKRSTEMLNLIKAGLLEQISADAAVEVQKLQILL